MLGDKRMPFPEVTRFPFTFLAYWTEATLTHFYKKCFHSHSSCYNERSGEESLHEGRRTTFFSPNEMGRKKLRQQHKCVLQFYGRTLCY